MSGVFRTLRVVRTRSAWSAAALAVAGASLPVAAQAQYIETYLPATVPGFDESQGVAVLSRPRPLYEALGIRAGDFMVRPSLDQSFGYNSNLLGTQDALGSSFLDSSAAVDVASDWARNRVGFSASVNNVTDFDAPSQSHTDATVGVGGSYTLGRGDASLGYTHLSEHENGTDIGAIASATPIGYDVDDVRGEVTTIIGPLAVTPNFDVADYRFGDATLDGRSVAQSYQNRLIASGGVTGRYDAGAEGLLLVLQGIDSHYTDPLPGQPSQDSQSLVALTGFDTQAEQEVWRLRLLAGLEYRSFTASQYGSRLEPIVEASVIWTPSRMLTLTGTVTRTVEEPQYEGTAGYVYTIGKLVADYELRRNILLQGRAAFQEADFLQGSGNQTIVSAGLGATWLLNRNIHISLNYDFASQHAPLNRAGPLLAGERLTGGNYTQHLVSVRLHLAL
jgi:hypothetical protein